MYIRVIHIYIQGIRASLDFCLSLHELYLFFLGHACVRRFLRCFQGNPEDVLGVNLQGLSNSTKYYNLYLKEYP